LPNLADLQIVKFEPNIHNVQAFDCDDADLNDFLKSDAARYQQEHLSCTRVALYQEQIVGYITLLADCIVLKTSEKKKWLPFYDKIYQFPALKIGRLGIQKDVQGTRIGPALLQYAIGLVVTMNRELDIGCRFITVDAYPKSISWYQKNFFVFNKHYNNPEKTHPSMRYDILKSPQIP
jgi:hypothetical protein